jgi:hypothetical protein
LEWIRPVLQMLGHSFNVQVPLHTPLGTHKPDYIFYPDETARLAGKGAGSHHDEKSLTTAVALGDAKAWEVDLDRGRGGPLSNPAVQIDFYLRHSNLPWAVLTNGRQWRLYHRDSAKKLDVYYEVDLPALVKQGNPDAFRYFYLFFRREAFTEGWLEQVLTGSQEWEQGVSSSLKEQVYESLRALAQGFLDFSPNGLRPSAVNLKAIYDNSLIALYRLLFIFYAESRGLLPLNQNRAYTETYSLHALKQRVAQDAPGQAVASMSSLWTQLRQLWRVLDGGNGDLGVPAYNGGLFSASKYPFLEQYRVGDLHLRRAIDLLARAVDPQSGRLEFVDYRDLEIRHLGSIYEGLLEYQLRYATWPLRIEKEKGREIYVPLPEDELTAEEEEITAEDTAEEEQENSQISNPKSQISNPKSQRPKSQIPNPKSQIPNPNVPNPLIPASFIPAGKVYLVTDKGERKATGSYYTPDHVVQHMVEQAIGPALAAVRAAHSDENNQIIDPAALGRSILSLNILDPAMGSGHFLVAATDYMARYIVGLGIEGTPEGKSQIPNPKSQIPEGKSQIPNPKSQIPEGKSQIPNPKSQQRGTAETALAVWRRLVAQACIYGVDMNPLAVELAKLSLWLATVARDKPLSFLDHHLRCGNSLVGAQVQELLLDGSPAAKKSRKSKAQKEKEAGQLSLWQDSAFVGSMRAAARFMGDIEALRGDTLDEVHTAERIYQETVRDATQRYRSLADVWTARHFGLAIEEDVWRGLAGYILRGGLELPFYARLSQQAHEIADGRRIFHWELEFPEVFFDEQGGLLADAGFDAIIGNPPYVRQEELTPLKPYLETAYPDLYAGTADLFVYFFGQGFRLLKPGRRLAYISSNSWLRANYATPLRAFLRTEAAVESLVDLGDNRVFADAPDVYPAILVVRREKPAENHQAQAAAFSRGEGLADFEAQLQAKFFPLPIHDQADSGWQIDSDAGRVLFRQLMARGRPLGEVVNGQMYRGVLTGLNEAFIVDQMTRDYLIKADPASRELLKPMLRGEDLRPWYQEDEGHWLIFTRRGSDIEAYPAVKAYLEQFRSQLEPRPADWEVSKEWPGRKPGSYQWFEIQDSVDYFRAFEKPKILWPDIAKFPRFSWDMSGYYLGNTGYIVVTQDMWLLGFLASRCAWFIISQTAIALGERAGISRYRLIDQYMRPLPIPEPTADQQEQIGALAIAISERAAARYTLHRQTRHRILTDLSAEGRPLNQKLTAWWQLEFAAFRAEVRKALKQDIPLRQRHDWESWLAEQQISHYHLTAAIVHLEAELNQQVYNLFDLTAAEIELIEQATKYSYGEI